MFFKVTADENFIHKQIFSGTMVYLPRIGEEIVIGSCVYTVKNVRHLICEGKNMTPDIQLYLKQKI